MDTILFQYERKRYHEVPPLKTIGERLKEAIEAMSDYSIRKFSLQMAGRGVTGASRPAVHRYLHATKPVEPPVAFLRAAAAELGVREAWLVLGEKPMRESVPLDPALTARVEDTWRWLLEGSG